MPRTVKSTVRTSPFLPPGHVAGGRGHHHAPLDEPRELVDLTRVVTAVGHRDHDDRRLRLVDAVADGVRWTELKDTPWKPRHAASVFVHDDALWMVAGNNMEPDVWKLQRK